MTIQTASQVAPALIWDDGVVFIFSFSFNGVTYNAGFPHVQIALANASGTQTQVSKILQTMQQSQLQVTTDPGCWIDTLKTNKAVDIVFDDSSSIPLHDADRDVLRPPGPLQHRPRDLTWYPLISVKAGTQWCPPWRSRPPSLYRHGRPSVSAIH